MRDKLTLLHAYIGGLLEEAEAGRVNLATVEVARSEGYAALNLRYTRTSEPKGCDHGYRRIASGEYECSNCGAITDEPEGEQWN
jgi:hypothetical protein